MAEGAPASNIDGKYIGLALAMGSTLMIGTSFVVTKVGLNQAAERHGFEGDGFTYLKNWTWWAGIGTLVAGEVLNFAAYAFAPAILVTPLGALSVLIGAILGSYFLGERLGRLGTIGCALCLVGSIVIVLHAPADEEVSSIEKMLEYALNPAFLFYCGFVAVFAFIMIYRIAPVYGKKHPMVYISICSTVGSVSVMAIKAFGIAVKLTLGGDNQFTHPSTYVFLIVVVVCIMTQMNYFNKALSQFSTNIVNPLYYVTFTTSTILASFMLFGGFNTTEAINTISLLCGFLVIFSGVYLLNLARDDPDGHRLIGDVFDDENGIPTDAIGANATRRSLHLRRASDNSLPRHSFGRRSTDRDRLIHDHDSERNYRRDTDFGLSDLAEGSDEDGDGKRTSFDAPPRHSSRSPQIEPPRKPQKVIDRQNLIR